MNLHRALWLSLPVALVLVAGCKNNGGTADPTDTATEALGQAAPRAHGHRFHHAGGPARMLLRAAKDLDLTEAQAASIQTLREQLRAEAPQAKAGHAAAHAVLLEGVRAGSIDIPKLQAAAASEREVHRAGQAAVMNQLWSTLSAPQRTALVAAVRARQAAHADRAMEWKHEGRADHMAKKLAHLTTTLELDATQQATVEGLLANNAPPPPPEGRGDMMRAHMDTLLTAFEGAAFDARTLEVGPPAGGPMPDPMMGHATFLSQLLPVLRADQREKLAASMDKQHGPPGGDEPAGEDAPAE